MSIFDASEKYRDEGVPLIIIAGAEYGTGSSRDWAAKGTRCSACAPSSRRATSASTAATSSAWACCRCSSRPARTARRSASPAPSATTIEGIAGGVTPGKRLTVARSRADDGGEKTFTAICRIDTPVEVDYYNHGGILPFVLRQLVKA